MRSPRRAAGPAPPRAPPPPPARAPAAGGGPRGGAAPPGPPGGPRRGRRLRRLAARQRQREAAAAPDAVARRLEIAAVHRQHALRDGEADAEPAVRASRRRAGLRVELEDVRQRVGRDAGAVVGDRHAHPVGWRIGFDADRAFGRREARGVVEQVAERLRQARAIGIDPDSGIGKVGDERVAARLQQRLRRLDRRGEQALQLQRLAVELDAALGDARDVEQIVDAPCEVVDLAAHDAQRIGLGAGVGARRSQHLDGAEDRRQRAAQLVRQRGQGFVLASAGVDEQPLGALAQRAVLRDADPALRLRGIVGDGEHALGDPAFVVRGSDGAVLVVVALAVREPREALAQARTVVGMDGVEPGRGIRRQPLRVAASVARAGRADPDEALRRSVGDPQHIAERLGDFAQLWFALACRFCHGGSLRLARHDAPPSPFAAAARAQASCRGVCASLPQRRGSLRVSGLRELRQKGRQALPWVCRWRADSPAKPSAARWHGECY